MAHAHLHRNNTVTPVPKESGTKLKHMQETKTDPKVAGNQSGQQNQGVLVNQDNQKNKSEKISTVANQTEKPIAEKELIDTEHQHDYKAPVGEKNRADENHDHKPTEETSSDKFQTLNEEEDNTEALTSETGAESKG